MYTLQNFDIKYIKGIGEARAKLLAEELDVHNVRDLIYYMPYRHDDRSKIYKISELKEDLPGVQIKGRFVRFIEEGEGVRKRLVGVFSDGRSIMDVTWFARYKHIPDSLPPDRTVVIFGKPSWYRGAWSMSHPEIETYDPTKPPTGLRGVYTVTEKMRKRGISSLVIQKAIGAAFQNPKVDQGIVDTLPQPIIEKYHLMSLREAMHEIHFPSNTDSLQRARFRLKFEELFYLELNILRYSRQRAKRIKGHVFSRIADYFNRFYNEVLPFPLTEAQKRVLREIRADMRTGAQMNRLLQGDVGCGKTMVAFMTMLMAADNGCQACLMAPTEILASQHYESLKGWCDRLGLNIRLLTGSTSAKNRREIHQMLNDGSLHFIVGTHALIEDKVTFHRLGLAVIDEQHRFGVAQRARLWQKSNPAPHVLVMTATPIPRTLAMTVYGDLEVSIIDELPPGRKPVTTSLHYAEQRISVEQMIYGQLRQGRQIYFVYPLITENEKLALQSLEQGYDYVCHTFPDYQVSYVHGRMKPDEKDYQMGRFVSGETRIMVATTVIEVGVNVPNATVMVIENAERFGLSQLHQLRGRVGRGADNSYCILMTKPNIAGDTRKRLAIMTETTDGFIISEADMKLRGPGDIEGTQQSGLAFNLRIANIARDGQIISMARKAAIDILDSNPDLSDSLNMTPAVTPIMPLTSEMKILLQRELQFRFGHTYDWSQIS